MSGLSMINYKVVLLDNILKTINTHKLFTVNEVYLYESPKAQKIKTCRCVRGNCNISCLMKGI
jgi:hypothetical protein